MEISAVFSPLTSFPPFGGLSSTTSELIMQQIHEAALILEDYNFVWKCAAQRANFVEHIFMVTTKAMREMKWERVNGSDMSEKEMIAFAKKKLLRRDYSVKRRWNIYTRRSSVINHHNQRFHLAGSKEKTLHLIISLFCCDFLTLYF